MSITKIIGLCLAAFVTLMLLLTVLFGWWYTVDEGERGVYLRNGAVIGVSEPGLGFKLPFIDSVARISIQQQTLTYEQVAAYSKDQQTAILRVSVSYAVPAGSVQEVYTRFGSLDSLQARLINRQVNEQVEIVFGRFNAITAVQDRARLSAEVSAAIKKAVVGPVEVVSVQVENIDFSDIYEKNIEAKMTAEVEVQKLRQNAEREKVQAEITVTQAKAAADSIRAEATAKAEATKLRGEAEAYAIDVKGKALRDNPALISLTQAERWNGQLPTTMLPGGTVPMLNLQ